MDFFGYSLIKDLLKGAYGLYKKYRGRAEAQPQQAFLARFTRIFENQDIQRTQIGRVLTPTFLIRPIDLLDDDRLLGMLDEPLLGHVTEQFGIERAWLDGARSSIYPRCWIYKRPENFVSLLAEMRKRHDIIEFYVIKGNDNNLNKQSDSGQIAAILRGSIATLDDQIIWRDYLLDDGWVWDHYRSRIELKVMCLIAWQFDLDTYCRSAKQCDIDKLISGESFCEELLKVAHGPHWHLDDYIFTSNESHVAKDSEEALLARTYLLEDEHAWPTLQSETGQSKLKLLG